MTLFELKFFEWDMPTPTVLLRISDAGHQIFVNSEWSSTNLILEYFAGERHDIEPIAEADARVKYPLAFN